MARPCDSPCVVRDGAAYVLTMPALGHFVMTAIDLESGDALWSYEAGDPVDSWSAASTQLHQLVVTKELDVMQVLGDEENAIMALDASDGSIAWEVPNALRHSDSSRNFTSNIAAVNDRYLVLTDREVPTGTVDGSPNADQSLGIALYDLGTGDLLWTDTEGTFPSTESGLCLVAPGWDAEALYVPCSTDDTLTIFRYPFEGGGEVERLGTWQTPEPAAGNLYDGEAAYVNTGRAILRVNLATGETSEIPLQGEACVGIQAHNDVVLCIYDDSLGTYTMQVYTPSAVETPVSTP